MPNELYITKKTMGHHQMEFTSNDIMDIRSDYKPDRFPLWSEDGLSLYIDYCIVTLVIEDNVCSGSLWHEKGRDTGLKFKEFLIDMNVSEKTINSLLISLYEFKEKTKYHAWSFTISNRQRLGNFYFSKSESLGRLIDAFEVKLDMEEIEAKWETAISKMKSEYYTHEQYNIYSEGNCNINLHKSNPYVNIMAIVVMIIMIVLALSVFIL